VRVFSSDVIEILDRYVDERVEQALELREREKRWLTVEEAAVYLGLTPAAVRRRISRGTLRHSRNGGRVFVDRRALDAALERVAT
jgi:excisionase family DNA binding protein